MLRELKPPTPDFEAQSLWYALRTRPHKEALVCEQAQIQGIETFNPLLRVRPVNPRARKVRPYFPGYVFVLADMQEVGISTFQYMPYTVGLVSFGGEPATVPASLIEALQRRVRESIDVQRIGPSKGDMVWIERGPFAGHQAMFDSQLRGGERVRLLLELLSGQSVPIEMDAAQIDYSQHI